MNKQKYSSKNYKRNQKPAKLLKTQYVGIIDYQLKADFDTLDEVLNFKAKNPKTEIYIIKTYKLNNKTITTKEKEN